MPRRVRTRRRCRCLGIMPIPAGKLTAKQKRRLCALAYREFKREKPGSPSKDRWSDVGYALNCPWIGRAHPPKRTRPEHYV